MQKAYPACTCTADRSLTGPTAPASRASRIDRAEPTARCPLNPGPASAAANAVAALATASWEVSTAAAPLRWSLPPFMARAPPNRTAAIAPPLVAARATAAARLAAQPSRPGDSPTTAGTAAPPPLMAAASERLPSSEAAQVGPGVAGRAAGCGDGGADGSALSLPRCLAVDADARAASKAALSALRSSSQVHARTSASRRAVGSGRGPSSHVRGTSSQSASAGSASWSSAPRARPAAIARPPGPRISVNLRDDRARVTVGPGLGGARRLHGAGAHSLMPVVEG